MCNQTTRQLFEKTLSIIHGDEFNSDQILPCASQIMINFQEASLAMMEEHIGVGFEEVDSEKAKNIRKNFSDNSELALGCAMQFLDNAIAIRGGSVDRDTIITLLVSCTEVYYKTFSMPNEIVPVCFPLELVDFYPVVDGMAEEIAENLNRFAVGV